MSGSGYERELKRRLEPYFLVVRAAGSNGFDLLAVRPGVSYPIEAKSAHGDAVHFSAAGGRAMEQYREHVAVTSRYGLPLLYAYRRIGQRDDDPWRLFGHGIPGLPAPEMTKDGNVVLRWETGVPLTVFLDRLPKGGVAA